MLLSDEMRNRRHIEAATAVALSTLTGSREFTARTVFRIFLTRGELSPYRDLVNFSPEQFCINVSKLIRIEDCIRY